LVGFSSDFRAASRRRGSFSGKGYLMMGVRLTDEPFLLALVSHVLGDLAIVGPPPSTPSPVSRPATRRHTRGHSSGRGMPLCLEQRRSSAHCAQAPEESPPLGAAVNDEVKTKRRRSLLCLHLLRRALSRTRTRAVKAVCQSLLPDPGRAQQRGPSEPHPVLRTWFTQPCSCLRLPRLGSRA
jgi:hypothetical protein